MIDNFYVAIDLIDHQPPLTVHGRRAGGLPHTIHEQGLWINVLDKKRETANEK